jgi:serine/threonine protein phosphatase PrpC
MIAGSSISEAGVALGGRLSFAALSDTGHVREHNEDGYLCDPRLGLFAVADGMGGANAGEVASELALDVLGACLRARPPTASPEDALKTAVLTANARVFANAQAIPAHRGMGTTLSTLLFARPDMLGAHVGDSRIYCFHNGSLAQLTTDHSPPGARNVLLRALGTKGALTVDTFSLRPTPGDVFLLASDGLEALTPSQIAARLGDIPRAGLAHVLDDLVGTAVETATDNVTAVLVRVEGP